MANYKISQVTIEVKPGVKLIAEVSNLTDLKHLLEDIQREGFSKTVSTEKKETVDASSTARSSGQETPESRIETRASLSPGILATEKVLAFKDNTPQLLRPSTFRPVSDATLSLLYAVEIGLKKSSISFDDFKDLHDAQNIKTGTPLPMLMTNLRNSGYIDKKAYGVDRTIRLTAKGAARAEEVIRGLCVK